MSAVGLNMTAMWTLVTGASGGVGATTIAAGLALGAAADGQPVCLVDGHFGGGGLEVTLGIERAPGLRWPDFSRAQGHIEMRSVLASLPAWRGVSVLSAARTDPGIPDDRALEAVLGSLARAQVTVILDAPVGWAQWLPHASERRGRALLVVARNLGSVAGGLAALRYWDQDLLVREEGVRPRVVATGHQHVALTPQQAAGLVGLELAGEVRRDSAVSKSAELGAGPFGADRGRALRGIARLDRVQGAVPGLSGGGW